MSQPLLDMRHVSISYDGETVVRDVSLQMNPGEILGIVGESGSGKSTLLRSVMGLLGSGGSVTGGEIFYKGQNITHRKGEEARKLRGPGMGMIFQNTGASLCPVRTVGDQLCECVREHTDMGREEIRGQAKELLGKLGLSDGDRILDSYPFELSGGMSQRAGILMAMILKPDLLLADEPTSALDVTVQKQAVREMMRMRDLYGTGIVVVTHNIGVVEYMADKIAVMYQGKLVEYGDAGTVIRSPQDPYTRKLTDAVLRVRRIQA